MKQVFWVPVPGSGGVASLQFRCQLCFDTGNYADAVVAVQGPHAQPGQGFLMVCCACWYDRHADIGLRNQGYYRA